MTCSNFRWVTMSILSMTLLNWTSRLLSRWALGYQSSRFEHWTFFLPIVSTLQYLFRLQPIYDRIVRNILADKPRVTRYQIDWSWHILCSARLTISLSFKPTFSPKKLKRRNVMDKFLKLSQCEVSKNALCCSFNSHHVRNCQDQYWSKLKKSKWQIPGMVLS